MFQLIIGVLLGIILLFVIVLLITEVGSTYPVWRQGERGSVFNDQSLPSREQRNPVRIFLLILVALLGLGIAVYLVSSELTQPNAAVAEKLPPASDKPAVYTKLLTGSSANQLLYFRLQTKWEEGKLYGNNSINFRNDSAWRFTDCRYHLLDKDGFLVKEIVFLPEEFVYMTTPEGRITGISNKFNAEISLREYQKIEKMQVVLDKRLLHLLP